MDSWLCWNEAWFIVLRHARRSGEVGGFFGVIKSLVDNEFLPSDIDVRSLVKDDIDFVVDFLVRYVK